MNHQLSMLLAYNLTQKKRFLVLILIYDTKINSKVQISQNICMKKQLQNLVVKSKVHYQVLLVDLVSDFYCRVFNCSTICNDYNYYFNLNRQLIINQAGLIVVFVSYLQEKDEPKFNIFVCNFCNTVVAVVFFEIFVNNGFG
eukprot:TRINITY_DN23824_c1_g2_i2.p1 TRINITY_DN23824_c1_g2~~TRINITY_DN23824_c1_g2_i2.p1  ORF type:complete len:142 (-),score=6.67 TRINITY_DN23824_c1_g2_i2:104-529(-)